MWKHYLIDLVNCCKYISCCKYGTVSHYETYVHNIDPLLAVHVHGPQRWRMLHTQCMGLSVGECYILSAWASVLENGTYSVHEL